MGAKVCPKYTSCKVLLDLNCDKGLFEKNYPSRLALACTLGNQILIRYRLDINIDKDAS